MSVINQMLKELEERTESTSSISGTQPVQSASKSLSPLKIALILLLIIVINICGIYAWNLYSENQSLKKEVSTHSVKNEQNNKEDIQTNNIIEEKPATVETKGLEQKKQNTLSVSAGKNTIDKSDNQQDKKEKSLEALETVNNKNAQQAVQQSTIIEPIIKNNTKLVVKNESVVVTPMGDAFDNDTVDKTETAGKSEKKPSLSISRSKLTPERVVKNKLLKAERAIIENNLPKAEELFEDILLIQPENKSARKQLSALWFGRKLYRPALNLLSQGIELYPNDADFRLMKARVLINQNNNEEALYVLKGNLNAKSVEYQLLLANTAQSLGNSENVILAYRQLVQLESYKGKWWMGLAVALDRDSQFEKAKVAYQTALTTGTLSSNSAQFIRQRMSELGE